MAGASTVGITIDDAAYVAGLRRAADRMVIKGEAHLVKVGLSVQNYARQLCPVDTGRLRASITMVQGRDSRGPYVTIGSNVEYAPYVEFGTRHMNAQPYLRPALMQAFQFWAAA